MLGAPGEDEADATSDSRTEETSSWGLTRLPSGASDAQQAMEATEVLRDPASDATTAQKDTDVLHIQMEYCPKTLKTVLDSGNLLDDIGQVDEAGAWQVVHHNVCCRHSFYGQHTEAECCSCRSYVRPWQAWFISMHKASFSAT